ncbi:MAG: hypothetical protein JWM88_280 [Verrucomicrobia bacterium]|nr:hypothetical protein [Verrucomicrobiota bacterium]
MTPPVHASVRPLCEQLAETCILQCYVMETLDAHQGQPTLRQRGEVHDFLSRMLEVLHQQTMQLATLLQPLPAGRPGSDTGAAAGFKNLSARPSGENLRAILLDDCALLNQATSRYKRLLTAALAERDGPTAALALSHLQELIALTEDAARILPPAPAPAPEKKNPPPKPLHYAVSVWQTSSTAA